MSIDNPEEFKKARQTKDRIFTVATALFNQRGFEKVTIREVCEHAGVAIGTFYLYFESKNAILYDIYRKADEVYETEQISGRNDMSPYEKILELIRIQFSIGIMLHVEPAAAKQLFVYQLQSDNQYFLSEDRAFHKQLFAVVEQGIAEKTLRNDMSSHDIGWRILRFSRGLLFDWCIHDCTYDLMDFGMKEMRIYLELFCI